MSLDVYLYMESEKEKYTCRYCESELETDGQVFEKNITHNLTGMASEAGIYKHLWRPEELGINFAQDLIKPLQAGLKLLIDDPEKFKIFNPENGWGNYDVLKKFVSDYLRNCKLYPNAKIEVSR